MVTTEAFVECSAAALDTVFGVHTNLARQTTQVRDVCSEDEQAVASLCFEGDLAGRVMMILRKQDIRKAIDWILARYDIQTPVEDHVVFAELLNIYVANLSTHLKTHALKMLIGTPDAAWRDGVDAYLEGTGLLAVQMQTDEVLPFTFVYLLSQGSVVP